MPNVSPIFSHQFSRRVEQPARPKPASRHWRPLPWVAVLGDPFNETEEQSEESCGLEAGPGQHIAGQQPAVFPAGDDSSQSPLFADDTMSDSNDADDYGVGDWPSCGE